MMFGFNLELHIYRPCMREETYVGVYNPSAVKYAFQKMARTRIRSLCVVPGWWWRRLFWHADGCSQCLFHSRRGGRDGGFDGRSRSRTQVGEQLWHATKPYLVRCQWCPSLSSTLICQNNHVFLSGRFFVTRTKTSQWTSHFTHQKRGSHIKNVDQHPKWDPAMVVRLEGRKRIDMTTSKMTSNKDTAGTAAACGSDRCISSAFGGIWFPPSTYLPMTYHQKGRTSDLGIKPVSSETQDDVNWSQSFMS